LIKEIEDDLYWGRTVEEKRFEYLKRQAMKKADNLEDNVEIEDTVEEAVNIGRGGERIA